MRRIACLAVGSVLIATSASAQLDCGTGGSLCETTKYGLGNFPDFRADLVPNENNAFTYTKANFGPNLGGTSYYFTAGDGQSGNPTCGPERGFFPYTGQIRITERTDCSPDGEGPTCAGGVNAGKPCHIVPPDQSFTLNGQQVNYVNPFKAIECPGSTCVDSGGGCRVELPVTDGGGVPGGGWTPPSDTNDALLPTVTSLVAGSPPSPIIINAHASQTWGGSSHGFCGTGPFPLCRTDADCPGGQTCTLAKGKCQGGPTPGQICSQTAQCGTGGTCVLVNCNPRNFRQKPSMGTRYRLPAERRDALGLPAGATYIRWDYGQPNPNLRVTQNTSLRTHSDSSSTCCAGTTSGCNQAIPGSNVYPLLTVRDCSLTAGTGEGGRQAFSSEDNLTNDWIFEGGRGTRWFSDTNHVLPGQLVGHCRNNRAVPCTAPAALARCTGNGAPYRCCTGPGAGTCGTECNALSDTCDLSEPGHRAQIVLGRDDFGDPRNIACAAAQYVLRGTPNQGCMLEGEFLVPGDPGADCGLFNFGNDRRLDNDCNGVADHADGCPFLAEWDQAQDTDGDCAGGVGGACRLDECECGDQSGDGRVNVADIVAINNAIFAGVNRRLCDANSDLNCNVSDIVSANREVFVPDSSTCRHITSSLCGNNAVDPGEPCDNGAICVGGPTPGAACNAAGISTCGTGGSCQRQGGDGCNTACRVEFGWSCTGSPSVCTEN
jgi:hypothetical protein